MTEHYEAALTKGSDWLTSVPPGASDKFRRDTLQAVFAAAAPELRKHFTQDPEVRRAIIQELVDEAEADVDQALREGRALSAGFIEYAEDWLRAKLKEADCDG